MEFCQSNNPSIPEFLKPQTNFYVNTGFTILQTGYQINVSNGYLLIPSGVNLTPIVT
jgi:hypothetical protein